MKEPLVIPDVPQPKVILVEVRALRRRLRVLESLLKLARTQRTITRNQGARR